MFLKRIEIKGFKSFADRIELDFISGITCVVGPNGSGKSNITDAIRWVLGEQKTSLLRGQKMEDLIFSGTTHRKPLNFAEVALVFDNSTEYFNTPFTEVKVKRRLHRSGESEYLLNEAPCRLKDIRELFMDTGIGIDGYSIIGQGNIDNILSDNKFDRRQIFEEAAGIVKFNTRKNESVRRLEKVEDNIDRLMDILTEIENRLGPLKEESDKAKEYLEIEQVVRHSEIRYLLDEYEGYRVDSQEALRSKKTAQATLESAIQQKTHHEQQQALVQQQIRGMRQELEGRELRIQHVQRERDACLMDIKVREEKLSSREHEIENLRRSEENERRHHDFLVSELAQTRESQASMKAQRIALQERLSILETELDDASEAFRLLSSDKDELTRQLASQQSQLEVLKSDRARSLEYTERTQTTLDERKEHEQRTVAAMDETRGVLKKNTADKSEVQDEIDRRETLMRIRRDELARIEDEIDEIKDALEETKRKQYHAESEYQLLDSLEKNMEGVQGYMKRILQYIDANPLKNRIRGIVADLIAIPEGYEEAMSVALGKSATQIVTDTEQDAKQIIDALKRDKVGRATFLPLSFLKTRAQSVPVNDPGFLGFGRDIVTYEKRYQPLVDHLLGKVAVVKTLEDGIRISKNLKGYYKVVTLDGDVIITNGPITGGSKVNNRDNLFKRRQESVKLGRQIETFKADVQKLKSTLDEKRVKADRMDSDMTEMVKELSQKRERLQQLETAQQVLIKQLEAEDKACNTARSQREQLEAEVEREQMNLSVLEEAIEELSREFDKFSAIISESQTGQVDERMIKDLEGEITTVHIDLAKLEEKLRATAENMEEKSRTVETLITDISDIDARIADSESAMRDEKDLLDKLRNNYSGLAERIKILEAELKAQKDTLSEQEDLLEEHFRLHKEQDEQIHASRQQIHELELEIARLDIKISNLSNRLWEAYDLSVAEARKEIETVESFIPKTELRRLRKRLKEIEHVNLNAIAEYEEVSARHTFLTGQLDDLKESKTELTRFIREMERKIVKSFRETFATINTAFSAVFSDLFGGGQAELRLTEPDDVLGTDIEILASPPGKNMKHINLLSGGEKALTAIALLFAVLKAKPTPFCVLDEIEAALDDSNVYRFGEFVRSFSKESQFILITHRKGTMEYADALYGVSMEEYGISKVISIKLSDYDFEEDIDDQAIVQ